MKKFTFAVICLIAMIGCDSRPVAPDPEEFVKSNFDLLDSCTNHLLQNMDAILLCDIRDSSYLEICEAPCRTSCDFVDHDQFLQDVLKTEIEFIKFSSDSMIVYVLEGFDEKNSKYAILYKKSRSARDLDWNRTSGVPLPEVVVENYYVVTF